MIKFQNSGSALRKVTKKNPRSYACPTCDRPNVLTKKDVDLGYQCDHCADMAEGKYQF
jgi:ribosomal protein L37AE/L43A